MKTALPTLLSFNAGYVDTAGYLFTLPAMSGPLTVWANFPIPVIAASCDS